MDGKIAAGVIKSDRRVIERDLDATMKVLPETIIDAIGPRVRSRRQLSPMELRSLVGDIDRVLKERRPVTIREFYRRPTRTRPRLESYERLSIDVSPCTDDGFLLVGSAIFANRKVVTVKTTDPGIFFSCHAAERVLERWGIKLDGAYRADQSPIRGIAVALVEQAGLLACYLRRVTQNIMIPALGGFFLGEMAKLEADQDDELSRGSDVRIGLNPYARVRHHPFLHQDVTLEIELNTFVHSYQGYPEQLQVKRKLEEFAALHRPALETMGALLLWRQMELFEPAGHAEIQAAELAFIPIAETVSKLPSPRNVEQENVA